MSFEQCTFSPESAEGYSQTSFSATDQLSLLSGSHTPAESCANEPQKDGSPACTCGKGTLGCLIHPSTPDEWTASMRDSLAKTLALLESRQVYLREPEVAFTAKSSESLAWFDRDTCSWRTYQRSLVTDSEPYSQTWPRWGMTLAGSAYAHPMSERRILEIDGFFLPTPTAFDVRTDRMTGGASVYEDRNGLPRRKTQNGSASMGLARLVQMWPTPTAHNAKETNAPSEAERNTPTLAAQVGGRLNPKWVGWLMGFPIGFTSSKDWVMPKSRSKLPQHGECSEVAE
jgi:hypothetical protein